MILTVTLNAAIDKRYVMRTFAEGEVNRVMSCVYTPGGRVVLVLIYGTRQNSSKQNS